MTTRDVSSWLPNLLGSDTVLVDGEEITTRRNSLNFVGATQEDDPDNDATRITVPGDLAALGGTAGQILRRNDDGDAWEASSDFIELPEDLAAGDLLYFDGTNLGRVPAEDAEEGWVLTFVSGVPTWAAPTGGGDPDPGFVPTDLAGIKAWYKMSLGATTGGGSITALADQSGTGDTAKDLTATGTIAYTATDAAYGNKATATFTGTQRMQNASSWAAAQTTPYTIYFVGHATDGRLFDGRTNSHLVMNLSSDWTMYCGSFISATGTDPTVPSFGCVVFNGASSSLYITDPATAAVTGNPGTTTLEALVLGALGGGGGELTGKIAEVIAYSGAHDEATRTQVMGYLADEYGL